MKARMYVPHAWYHADDQVNDFTDDKDQCDGKGADSGSSFLVVNLCTPATAAMG